MTPAGTGSRTPVVGCPVVHSAVPTLISRDGENAYMEDIFVGRLMSAPVETVGPETRLDRAATQLLEHDIGSVVVVDDAGGLEGILTATDFVRLAADDAVASGARVSEYMSTDVVTATVNTPITEVADTMIGNRFHHVPVVDETEGVVGIITTTDLTAYVSGR
jgi:CBS domain-containing protein